MDELIQELDEDVEGMQGTIYFLQQELQRNSKPDSNTPNASATSSNALQINPINNANFEKEVVTLTVKITDLCAQCQVTNKQKVDSMSTSDSLQLQVQLKMELDDDRTNVNDRTCVNGENSNSSHSSDVEIDSNRNSNSQIHTQTSNSSTKNDRTLFLRTSVTNSSSEFSNEPNSDSNNVSSVSHSLHNNERTKVLEGKNCEGNDTDDDSGPPVKRTKVGRYEHENKAADSEKTSAKQLLQVQNQNSSDGPVSQSDTINSLELSAGSLSSSSNRNGSIEH